MKSPSRSSNDAARRRLGDALGGGIVWRVAVEKGPRRYWRGFGAHGFKPLVEEWWHFTLADEPYPDTYFTFPVNSDSVAGASSQSVKGA